MHGYCGYPPIPPGVFGASWTEGSTVSTFVFRNVEAKFLKTWNLCSLVCAIEPETTLRIL